MNNSASPFSVSEGAPDLVRRFALILAGLAALVARRFVRMPHLVGIAVLLWGRLNRAVRRLERAMTQAPARVRPPRPRRNGQARERQQGLPSGRGWLVRELGWEGAGYMAQLEALLAEPASQAMLARLPAAGRVLRPICRMLGVVAPAVATPAAVIVPSALMVAAPERDLPVWPGRAEGRLDDDGGDCSIFATSG